MTYQVSPSIGFLESRLLCNVNQDGGRPVQRSVVFVGCLLKKLTDFDSNSNMIIFLKRLVIFQPLFVSF